MVLYDRARRGGFCVVTCTPEAERAGVRPGLPLAEARALLAGIPHARYERHDPQADREALRELAARCQCFSPYVGIEQAEAPESLLLDLDGVAHLFGDEPGLAAQLVKAFKRKGYRVRVAVADTIGAAWAVAHFDPASGLRPVVVPPGESGHALGSLPVKALRLPGTVLDQLHTLGLDQIGQVLALPRAGLPSRFGPVLLERLDQATGRLGETFVPHRPAEPVEAEWPLEHPTADRRVLEGVCRELLGRIVAKLSARREGVLRLWCCLETVKPCEPVNVSVELIEPRACLRDLRELLRLRLDRITLSAEVCRVHLLVTQTAGIPCHQRELFDIGQERQRRRELARLLDRLSSRLGAQAVLRPRICPDHQPEYAVRFRPVVWADKPDQKKRSAQRVCRMALPLSRPVRLQPRPVAVEVMAVIPDGPPVRFTWKGRSYAVERWWGPERIATGWWRIRDVQRDYYRVETEEGRRFWLFREVREEDWFLHGTFE